MFCSFFFIILGYKKKQILNPKIKIFSVLLLFFYSTYVFRVIFPIIDYAINYSYIIAELCVERENPENMCLGKCHLSNEIKKQVTNETKNNEVVNIEFFKIPHIFFNKNKLNNKNQSFIRFTLNNDFKEIFFALEPKIPPPKYFS